MPTETTLDEPGRSFELGFFIRWGARKNKHNYEAKIALNHREDHQDSQDENKKG